MRPRCAWPGVGVALCMTVLTVAPARAQAGPPNSARIWGTVHTVDGAAHEGFIRWDRNEATWADALHGVKEVDRDLLDRMAESLGDEADVRGRSVEFLGVRISWEDDGEADRSQASVRFGHLAWIERLSDASARIGLKSGEELDLSGTSTDLGTGMRELVVDAPAAGRTELSWSEIERVDFAAAPADARPSADRLYGTLEDRWGRTWSGFIAWDLDEALSTDVLDGEVGGVDREVAFSGIRSIRRRIAGGAHVSLLDGEELVMEGSNDVDSGHRGVQISDPGLGLVDVDWRDVREVRFATPPSAPGYHDFDGGVRLEGTLVTDDGERLVGRVTWDADESWSWEVLNGDDRGVVIEVELSQVARIDRASSRAATVTLRDGRKLGLAGSTDVGRSNRGIVVELADGTLRVVDWSRFETLLMADRAPR